MIDGNPFLRKKSRYPNETMVEYLGTKYPVVGGENWDPYSNGYCYLMLFIHFGW